MAEIPKPDSPEVVAASERAQRILIENAPRLFHAMRTREDCFLYVESSIGELERIFTPIAARGAMTAAEIHSFTLATSIAFAVLKTMQNSPLYDSRALVDQLVHNFAAVVKSATVSAVAPIKPT